MSKMTKTLATATIVAGCASAAFAQSPPPYSGGYGAYGPPPPNPVAPYGYANPSYSNYYGTYSAYSWRSVRRHVGTFKILWPSQNHTCDTLSTFCAGYHGSN